MWDYGTAHAISEIITQADVRIKKLVRSRASFGAIAVYGPKTEKKTRVRTHAKRHDPQSLHRQKCEVRTLFWSPSVPGAHQMEPPSLLISWVNPYPSRFINRTIFFCNALESHECTCCLLSFLYFHWLFPLSARETSPGNRSIYKSTRERVDSKGLYGRCRLHLMGSCPYPIFLSCKRA